MRRIDLAAAMILVAGFIATAGCSDTTEPEPEVAVRIQPRAVAIFVGQAADFSFVPEPAGRPPALEFRDSSFLQIAGPRRIIGAAAGETYAVVRSAGQLDSVPVAVRKFEACVAVLALYPADVTLRVGDVLPYRVWYCGNQQTGFRFTSTSSAVTVTEAGLATARERGSAVITARSVEDSTQFVTATVRVE